MASEFGDPKAPQAEIVTTKGTNNRARVGPYTDPNLTLRNVVQTPDASDLPPPSGSKTLGGVRPVYATDQNEEIDNTAAATENASVEQPPHSPNSWPIEADGQGIPRGNDPYRTNGVIGRDYLNNQGG